MFPLHLRGHRDRSRRNKGRRLESSVDHLPPQDIRSHCYGYSSPSYDSQSSLLILCRLCFCIRHFKSNWSCHWNRNWRHDSRPCGGLDLRHFHESGLWGVCLCFHKSFASQGLLAAEVGFGWYAFLQVFGRVVGDWRDRGCDDLGHLKQLMPVCEENRTKPRRLVLFRYTEWIINFSDSSFNGLWIFSHGRIILDCTLVFFVPTIFRNILAYFVFHCSCSRLLD